MRASSDGSPAKRKIVRATLSMSCQCLAISCDAGIHCRSRKLLGKKGDLFRALVDEMLRRDIRCATVFNAHQIVTTTKRIWRNTAIQQDNRDPRAIQSGKNLVVDAVLGARQFKRSEEDARDPALDVLMAKLLGNLFLLLARVEIAPDAANAA